MIVIIEVDTEKYEIRATDKATGNVWMLESEPVMDGTVITPDTSTEKMAGRWEKIIKS